MKKGTLLECVDPRCELKKGVIYKYIETNVHGNYMIQEEKGGSTMGGFFPNRFKTIKANDMNEIIGTKVKCVDHDGSSFLDERQEYIVISVNEFGNWQVQELNDGPKSAHWYKPERFIVVKEKAKKKIKEFIDFNKKYQTRSGQEVNLIGRSKDADYPIVGEYKTSGGNWSNESWTEDGHYFAENAVDNHDLVEVIDEISINCGSFSVKIYKDKSVYIHGSDIDETISVQEMKEIVEAWNSFS